jgi:hypothetical protein
LDDCAKPIDVFDDIYPSVGGHLRTAHHIVRLDRELALAAVDEHREFYSPRSTVVQ